MLVKQSPEHYLRWSWNLGNHIQQGPYSIITPVYVSYNDPQTALAGSSRLFDGDAFWLRLERRGDTITALLSTDGNSWKVNSEIRVRFAPEVQVGVWCGKSPTRVMTAGYKSSEYEFHFEDFQVSPSVSEPQ